MAVKGKTVLILGNGFDLAHKLPTRYSDFLEFCKKMEYIYSFRCDGSRENEYRAKHLTEWTINNEIKEMLFEAFRSRKAKMEYDSNGCLTEPVVSSTDKNIQEIHECLQDNVWYMYLSELFYNKQMRGENWIDFESEICFIIRNCDENATNLMVSCEELYNRILPKCNYDEKISTFFDNLNFDSYNAIKGYDQYEEYENNVRDLREKCFDDLERITRALELYLSCFVEKISIAVRVPEIEKIKPDYVISFNYTNTYEKIYGGKNVFHIHGKCISERDANENNMILGIDEYWSEKERDSHTNFTIFKKFAQRIQKKTGIENYKYLIDINKIYEKEGAHWSGNVDITTTHTDGTSFVYVFGHSLDVTDKDILIDFFMNEATAVTIYCRDKGTEGELIANVIQIITEKRLLEKANQAPTKLEFIIQEMNKI